MVSEWSQSGPRVVPEWSKSGPRVVQESTMSSGSSEPSRSSGSCPQDVIKKTLRKKLRSELIRNQVPMIKVKKNISFYGDVFLQLHICRELFDGP